MQDTLIHPRRASADEIGQVVLASPTLSAEGCLGVYQRSYFLRLLQCLEEQFPALCHALGKELFAGFAREYLQQKPPASHTLHDLGRRFPIWLEETRPDEPEAREGWIDFMVDLALFEREVFTLFDAPGNEGRPFALETTPDHRLRLQPCFKAHVARFPVARYYHEVRKEKQPVLPAPERTFTALVRKDFIVHTLPLSALEHHFLIHLAGGLHVRQALQDVARSSGRSMEELVILWAVPGGLRSRWLAAGFFVDADSNDLIAQ